MRLFRSNLVLLLLLVSLAFQPVFAQTACAPSAMSTGGTAQVAPGIALLLRDSPGFAGVPLLTLPENTSLVLLEGALCQEGALWWRVQDASGTQGWAAEHDGSTILMLQTVAPVQPPTAEPLVPVAISPDAAPSSIPTALLPVELDFLPEVIVNTAPPGVIGVFGSRIGAYVDAASLRVIWQFDALSFGQGSISVTGRLTAAHYVLSGHSTWIIAPDNLKLIAQIPGESWSPLAISPDGRWLAVSHGGPTLGLFDLQAEDIPGSRRGIASVEPVSLAFAPDSARLAVGERSGAVFVVDAATSEIGPVMPLDMGVDLSVRFLRWSGESRLAAIGRDVLYLMDVPALAPDVEQAARLVTDGWTTRAVIREGWLYLDKYTPTVGNMLVRINAVTGDTLVQDDLGAPTFNNDGSRGLIDNESGVAFYDAISSVPLAVFPGVPYRTSGVMDADGQQWAVFLSDPESPRLQFFQHPNYTTPAAEIPFPPANPPRQLQMQFVNGSLFVLADGQLWKAA